MKNLSFLLGVLALVSFSTKVENTMKGVYKMTLQTATNGTDKQTSVAKQLKIYTEDFMMYANVNPADSTSSFGIGTYTESKSEITEKVLFAAWGAESDDNLRTYALNVKKTPKGYNQVISNMGSDKITLTENYESVGTNAKSVLNGAWKQVAAFNINGNDTTKNAVRQYKTYYGGYFIWGHTNSNPGMRRSTGIGFGTYKMNDKNSITETVEHSSYSELNGLSLKVDIEMKDSNSFKQTIVNNDGSKMVEVYERLKK